MSRFFVLIAALFSFVGVAPASAATLLYTLTDSTGHVAASFQLDDHPTPSPFFNDAVYLFDVPGSYADGSTLASLIFYGAVDGGGITIGLHDSQQQIDFSFLQLFTGTLENPVLLAFGPTPLSDNYGSGDYIFSAVVMGVPEPTTWAMLILGFGMVGFVVRRRADVAFA